LSGEEARRLVRVALAAWGLGRADVDVAELWAGAYFRLPRLLVDVPRAVTA
jgi:hypothetical protein